MKPYHEIEFPLRTYSLNRAEQWYDRYKRSKKEKKVTKLRLLGKTSNVKLPVLIEFTRLAPRMLDAHDNLPGSLKHVIDAVCEVITGDSRPGRADGHKDISIKINQEKSKKYKVRIAFYDS